MKIHSRSDLIKYAKSFQRRKTGLGDNRPYCLKFRNSLIQELRILLLCMHSKIRLTLIQLLLKVSALICIYSVVCFSNFRFYLFVLLL